MATSTLLQSLNTDTDFGGVSTVGASNRRQVETFIAKETLLVGDWVAFDYAATADGDVTLGVFKADGNSTPVRTPMGVVLRGLDFDVDGVVDLSSGKRVEVVLSGVVDALTGDNGGAGMAIGALLQITNTAGQVDAASAASAQPVCGILAETVAAAAGAGIRRVVVRKSF